MIHLYDSAIGITCHSISSSRCNTSAIQPWCGFHAVLLLLHQNRKYEVVHSRLICLPYLRLKGKSGRASGTPLLSCALVCVICSYERYEYLLRVHRLLAALVIEPSCSSLHRRSRKQIPTGKERKSYIKYGRCLLSYIKGRK